MQRKGGEEEEEEEDVMEGLSTPRLNRTSHMLDADGQVSLICHSGGLGHILTRPWPIV